MANNKQIDMRKIKRIFKLYTTGASKRQISLQFLGKATMGPLPQYGDQIHRVL